MFWKAVNSIINDADILILVLDSRYIDETRNKEVEDKVAKSGKPFIYALNKCDLSDQEFLEMQRKKMKHSVFVSSTEYHGIKMLKEKIYTLGSQSGLELPRVGLLGYPNVGKSSLANALKGKGSAPTSSVAGHTRGTQHVRAKKFLLLDSPGVIPYRENDDMKHAMIGAKSAEQIKEPEDAVFYLLDKNKEELGKRYNVKVEDYEDFLDAVAIQKNYLIKGGVPDTERAARAILKEWQSEKHIPK